MGVEAGGWLVRILCPRRGQATWAGTCSDGSWALGCSSSSSPVAAGSGSVPSPLTRSPARKGAWARPITAQTAGGDGTQPPFANEGTVAPTPVESIPC